MKNAYRSLCALLLLGLAACPGDMGANVTIDQACDAYYQALCGRIQQCAPLLLGALFPDVATCVGRFKPTCIQQAALNGSTVTPQWVQGCGTALQAASCADLQGPVSPAACVPPAGTLADGAACGIGTQCKSTSCKLDPNSNCGKCAPVASAGQSCATSSCAANLVCANQTCTTPVTVTEGGDCTVAASHCQYPLSCVQGKCVKPLAAGADCSAPGSSCDASAGLVCSPANKKCATIQVATTGQACGLVNNALVGCGGGACKIPNGSMMGMCVAPVADGGMCDSTQSLVCQAPASCKSGTCQLFDPSTCK